MTATAAADAPQFAFVPPAERRTRPIPARAERALLTALRDCWYSAGKCRVTLINSMRPRVSTYRGPPHEVLLDWSLVELVLMAESCAGFTLPRHQGRFFVQIRCLFCKVLAWRMAAEGEQALARYFFGRYRDDLPSAFTASERRFLDKGRYPSWKIALVTQFLLEHEFMHAACFESEAAWRVRVEENAARTGARLDRARPFEAEDFASATSEVCDARSWDEFMQFLGRDDPGFAEEMLADQFAFDQVVRRRWRFRTPTRIGRLIGCIFGVSFLIEELTAHASPSTLFPWHRTGVVDEDRAYDVLDQLTRISDRWRFRATEGLRACVIMRIEHATSVTSMKKLIALMLYERRRLGRMTLALQEEERTVRQFDAALAFFVESPAIQPYADPAVLDAARGEVPPDQWVALRAQLASL